MKFKSISKIVWRIIPCTLLAIAFTAQLSSNLAAKFTSRSASDPTAARVAKFDPGTLELVSTLPELTITKNDVGVFGVPVSFTVAFPQSEVACKYTLTLRLESKSSTNVASLVCPSVTKYYTVTSSGFEEATYTAGKVYCSITSSINNSIVNWKLPDSGPDSASEIQITFENETVEIGETHTYALTVFLQNQSGSNETLKLGAFDIHYIIHTEQVD